MKKKILSVLLCLCMVCTLLPVTAMAAEHSHDGWTALTGVDISGNVIASDPEVYNSRLTTGSYYLTSDLSNVKTLDIFGNHAVTLCLNGHSITSSANPVITVAYDATLTICDCTSHGTISGSGAETIVNDGGSLTLESGTVTNNYTGGTAVRSTNRSGDPTPPVFTMTGGTVSATGSNGTGVYNYDATAKITGGTVSAPNGEGRGVYNSGTLDLSGGSVSGREYGIYNIYNSKTYLSNAPSVSGTTADIYIDGTHARIYANNGDSNNPIAYNGGQLELGFSDYNDSLIAVSNVTEATKDKFTLTTTNTNVTLNYVDGTLKINKPKPTQENFNITTPTEQDYTGSAISVTAPTAKIDGTGTVTVYYAGEYYAKSKNAPTNAGDYTVTFDVAEGDSYAAASGFSIGTLTIKPANQTPSITSTASVAKGGNTVDLKPLVTNAKGDVSFSISGDPKGCSIVDGVLTSGSSTGSVTVSVSINGKDMNDDSIIEYKPYTAADAITVSVIEKPSAALPGGVNQVGWTYGETEKTPTYTKPDGTIDNTIKVTYAEGSNPADNAFSANVPTNAGEYTVKVVLETTDKTYTGTANFTISPATMTGITVTDYNGIYDGAPHGITVNGVPDGATVTYSIDRTNYTDNIQFTAATNGAQTVYYKVSKANHDDFTGSATVTIAKATPNVTNWPTVSGTVYVNDTNVSLGDGAATGVGSADLEGNFALGTIDLTSAGEKTVSITFTPDSTNYEAVTKDDKVNVSRRQVISVAVQSDITDKVYGTAQANLGLPSAVTITASGIKTFENVPVTWSGYDSTKLTTQTLTGTLNLAAISAEVEQPTTPITATIGVTLQTRTAGSYDYQPKSAPYTGSPISHEIPTLEGVASISYSYSGTGETHYEASATAPTNAGSYQVTATFTMEDGYASVGPKTAALTITKAEVSEPTVSGTYTYTGVAQTVTLSGVLESCMTVSGNTATNAGEHTVTVTLDGNHQWAAGSDGSVTWTIAKATITVTANNQSIYIGEAAPTLDASSYTVTGLVNGETLATPPTVVYASEPNTAVAGTVAINVSGAAAPNGNYNEISYVTGTLTISARPSVPSGGGSYTPPTYKMESEVTEDADGSVSFSKSSAKKGDTVIITVTPDTYYQVEEVIVKDSNGKIIEVTENKDGTFSFEMPASKVTVEPVFSWDNPFTDVNEDAYYAPAVEWALKNSVTGGTGDGTTFSPADSCTRAQMATFLWRAAGSPDPVGSSNPFADISEDAYYAKAVQWAYEQGITGGTSANTFSPDADCTRAQMVTFLHRVADTQKPEGNTNPFTDVPDAYYTEAVQWAYEQGITGGTSANTFSPDAICARGQMVTFLYRCFTE